MVIFLLVIAAAYLGCVALPLAARYDRDMQNHKSPAYQDTHQEQS